MYRMKPPRWKSMSACYRPFVLWKLISLHQQQVVPRITQDQKTTCRNRIMGIGDSSFWRILLVGLGRVFQVVRCPFISREIQYQRWPGVFPSKVLLKLSWVDQDPNFKDMVRSKARLGLPCDIREIPTPRGGGYRTPRHWPKWMYRQQRQCDSQILLSAETLVLRCIDGMLQVWSTKKEENSTGQAPCSQHLALFWHGRTSTSLWIVFDQIQYDKSMCVFLRAEHLRNFLSTFQANCLFSLLAQASHYF